MPPKSITVVERYKLFLLLLLFSFLMIIIRIVSHCQGQLKLASLSKDEMHSNLNIAQGFKHRWEQIHEAKQESSLASR